MAGGKKTAKKLTPEEWLKQALVPVEEQPYAVPGNWCWVRIENIATILNGYAFKSQKYVDKGIRIIRIANVQDGYIEDDKPVFYPFGSEIEIERYMLESGDLLISLTGNVGRVAILNSEMLPAALNQRVGCLRFNRSFMNKSLLFYYFLRREFQDSCIKNSKGSAQLNMSTEWLKIQPVPIPPITEQRRIVELIESLFAKLDEAREKVQAVADGFELRRSAVLQKAFSGELTERWRQEHGVVLESWKRFSISSVCNSLKYGTAKKSEKTGSVVVIRMGNLQRGEIDWSDLAYSNDKDDIEKYHLDAGDVLFNRTNSAALVGKTSIYRGEYPAIYAGYLIKLDYKHDIITGEFLNYALNTNHAKEYCNSVKTDGVNQSNINAKKIGAYIIPVPTIDEQVKIVECLQNLLKKEQQAQKAVESAIDQIDIIKKAILSRAFRGELGTNDPKEENAENLLLKMFKEKDNVEHKIKPAAKDKTDTKTVHNFKSSLEETIYQFILNHPECTLSEMKSLSGNFSDINKALLHLKQNKKVQISNRKYRVIIQDEDSISSIQ